MILQTLNIVAGVALSTPKLKEWFGEGMVAVEQRLAPLSDVLGLITLAVGIVGLIDRLNLLPFYIPNLGSSYPQAIPAIIGGALLAAHRFDSLAPVKRLLDTLKPHEAYIGLACIATGLGSLLFGCLVC